MKVVTDVKIVEVSHVEFISGQLVATRTDIIPTELPTAECDC